MRNTPESGQISRSKKRPRRTLGRGSRTNSNTSRQIPARVIDAAYDTLPASAPKRRATIDTCSRPVPSGRLFPPWRNLSCLIAGQRSRDELQVDCFMMYPGRPRATYSIAPVSAGIFSEASRGLLKIVGRHSTVARSPTRVLIRLFFILPAV